MAQLTITVPNSALPMVAEVKAFLEAKAGRAFTNEQLAEFAIRSFVKNTRKQMIREQAETDAGAELGAVETDYPED